jgi:hypothetical protein
MAKKRREIPVSKAKVTDDDRTIYAILCDEFTAADLQKYTEIEPLTIWKDASKSSPQEESKVMHFPRNGGRR